MELITAHETKDRFNSAFNDKGMYCYIMPKFDVNHAKAMAHYVTNPDDLRNELTDDSILSKILTDYPNASDFELCCFNWDEFDINKRMLTWYPIGDFVTRHHLVFDYRR